MHTCPEAASETLQVGLGLYRMGKTRPQHLHSRQWSCSELGSGMAHLVQCKSELPDETLQAQLEDHI